MSNSQISSNAADVLSAVPYFADLDTATLETIARSTIRQNFDTGQIVFLEGEECAGLYVVQKGWFKAVKLSPAGREQVMRFVGAGDTFNEIGVLAGLSNPATAIALEPSSVWIIPSPVMLQLLDEQPGLARLVIQTLSKHVLYLVEMVEDLSLRPAEARLARVILEHASGGVLQRRRWATQAEIAARLGTVPDVVSRVLRSLAQEGIIRTERREIHILDQQALEAKAMLDT